VKIQRTVQRGIASGLLAVAVALSVGELAAGIVGARSPVIAVGDAFIDRVPEALKTAAISVFGTADKVALVIGIVAVLVAFGAALGAVASRTPLLGAAGVVLLGLVGLVASVEDRQTGVAAAVFPALAATLAGLLALAMALQAARDTFAPATRSPMDRRAFLRMSGVLAGVTVVASVTGRWLQASAVAVASRARVVLPRPASPRPPVPAAADFGIDGLAPFVTPNELFYRIDTALRVPQVAAETWTLRIDGMVQRPLRLTYAQLLAMPLVEADITLACVSNEVGGELVGNARWLGVRLSELLGQAGVHPSADQIVGRSVDGFACGFPVPAAFDRDALVAVGMNGEPLPIDHGFPARLVVPGLYGYVSATKWLAQIELTTFAAFDHYWVSRGWAVRAPIKTQSRIDVPRGGMVAAGAVTVAGVAWAPTRGIRLVEVQVDDGPWEPAEMAAAVSETTWRQWRWTWQATPGPHVLRVRATDDTGATQPQQRRPPVPDGATGWHSIDVRVA
jgi:DMSO/TMAO reductase YedYZ molybdopterin-dependent catalytic subunit